ncbi:BTB/POZ domain-containing protein [Sesamum angolense]|uniref:BTB/POZ domain-containing protein n=1 Tax=Sesamum angolense TaxID=2727404 RepID=A0AAE1X4R4_9LAMI|nr:BTB/POZ domain-containing protein [Sesamum angolense]
MATGGDNDNDGAAAVGAPKKKQRVGSNSRLSSSLAVNDSFSEGNPAESHHKPPAIPRSSSHSMFPVSSSSTACGFNDPATGDVILSLCLDRQSSPFGCLEVPSESSSLPTLEQPVTQIYLHSRVLCRSKYFSALLSDRWRQRNDTSSSNHAESSQKSNRFHLVVPATTESMSHHLTVLKLLYSDDLLSSLDSVSTALNLLPVALELLFEDCIKACVKFLEAVPWSEDEEKKILNLIPFLSEEESKELLARMSPLKNDSSEEMLHGLILAAIHNHSKMAFAKAFVAKLLRDFSSRESARRVLDTAFDKIFSVVKQSLEEYSSPVFTGDHNETEAIQRLNLHTAMINGKHLLWLMERMIELRVADTAAKAWSQQTSFTGDLQRALRDDAWWNIVPSLPSVVLRCTCRLANAMVAGNILADRQVRMDLVRDWLPVLITCKDSVSPMGPNHKSLYLELEETFLRIISTLPISDAQELLQQCLSFSTRSMDDCPHLVAAFTTWFRRANRPPKPGCDE